MVIMETERLILRQLTDSDIHDLLCLVSDPIVMEFCSGPLTNADAQRWLAAAMTCYEKYGYDYWAVEEKESSNFVGQMGILRQELDGTQVDCLAFMLHHQYWNRGYASEGARACLRYAFTTLRLENIMATVEPGNAASIAILKKIGMKQIEDKDYAGNRVHVYSISQQIES